jgi:hypothetical protein
MRKVGADRGLFVFVAGLVAPWAISLGGCGDDDPGMPGTDGAVEAGDGSDAAFDTAEDAGAEPDAGEGDAGDADAATGPIVPRVFQLEAYALERNETGPSAECALSWIFELLRETERTATSVTYEGRHGGEVTRVVENADDEMGFEFHVDVFGEVIVTHTQPDELEIRIPVNEGPENSRFYRALARLTGTIDENGEASGTWTCAPLDLTEGYEDNTVSAEGTWTTTAIDPNPPGDPCAINNGDCDPMTTCTSVDGIPSCGPCPEGYVGTGLIGCFRCLDDNDCEAAEYCDPVNGNVCAVGCRTPTEASEDNCPDGLVCDWDTHECGSPTDGGADDAGVEDAGDAGDGGGGDAA